MTIREEFRHNVLKRDGFKCVFCDETHHLDAHHIQDRHEMPNGGYVIENGITVCGTHHLECEKFHMTQGKEWVPGKHPNDLYALIGSSEELAIQKSLLI